jgi:hypothetical protein
MKSKMKYCILFFTALLLINQTYGQKLQIGVEAGVSAALTKENSYVVSVGGKIKDDKTRIGARLGLPITYQVSNQFKLNSGLFYTMKGTTQYPINRSEYAYQYISIAYSTLEIPLCITYYTKPIPQKNTFFIGAGPYIGNVLYGKLRYYNENGHKETRNFFWGNTDAKDLFRHLDLGFQIQTGLVLKNGLLCKLVLQRSFNDMSTSTNEYLAHINNIPGSYFTQIKNQVYASLSVAYFLKHKSKH